VTADGRQDATGVTIRILRWLLLALGAVVLTGTSAGAGIASYVYFLGRDSRTATAGLVCADALQRRTGAESLFENSCYAASLRSMS
jgi:hypothetical protein